MEARQHQAAGRFAVARPACSGRDANRAPQPRYADLAARLIVEQLVEVAGVAAGVQPDWLRRRLRRIPLTAEHLAELP